MKRLEIDFVGQGTMLPTGCESASAAMLLRWMGVDITAEEFVERYLPCRPFYRDEAGCWHGPDPRRAFVGDPHDAGALGCYAPVLARAMEAAGGGALRAVDETGTEPEELCRRYIDRDLPVLLWVSIDLRPTVKGPWYRLEPEGTPFLWLSNEHCVLLGGYDEGHYLCWDPWQDRGAVRWPRELVRRRHRELGMQAVALVRG